MSNEKKYLTIVISYKKDELKYIPLNQDSIGGEVAGLATYDAIDALNQAIKILKENEEENADIIKRIRNITKNK